MKKNVFLELPEIKKYRECFLNLLIRNMLQKRQKF